MLGWLRTLEVTRSLSARRAWIEISMGLDGRFKLWSLSARRAWIEIGMEVDGVSYDVSLSARRAWIEIIRLGGLISTHLSRSPQGERG